MAAFIKRRKIIYSVCMLKREVLLYVYICVPIDPRLY